MSRYLVHLSFVLTAILLAGCSGERQPRRAPVMGYAFIGPLNVKLKEELAPSARVVATLHHGQRVDIIQTRRRFVKVRADNGVEGWTDTRQLLTPEQMGQLDELSARAAKLEPTGRARAYDLLNMHSEPNRHSPSFYQMSEGTEVDVLTHRVTERTPPPPQEPIVKRPPPAPRKKKAKAEPKIPPVPKPPAAPPPANWLELSKRTDPQPPPEPDPAAGAAEESGGMLKAKRRAPPEPPPVKVDDWSLVRTRNGKAGWVLTRMLTMAIPDEVAQYSEGARITSYFALAEVDDDGLRKHHWLWTTSTRTGVPYDFDSFRVFIWNKRRDRYETSYIERGLEGYLPVAVEGPKFSVLLKREDGSFYRKTFVLEGYLTRWLGNEEARPPADPLEGLVLTRGDGEGSAGGAPAAESLSLAERLKAWTSKLFKRS